MENKLNPSANNVSVTEKENSFSRKDFLKITGLSAAAAFGLSTCTEVPNAVDVYSPLQIQPDPRPGNGKIWIGSGDIGLMNTIHIYTRLEAAFYTKVLKNPYQGMSPKEETIFNALKNHEIAHSDFLSALLGDSAIQDYANPQTGKRYNFDYFNFNNREEILKAAFEFENIGVSMYNCFPCLVKRAKLMTVLIKLGSVEARQASALQFVMDPSANFTNGIIGNDDLDVFNSPKKAWSKFQKFLSRKFDNKGLPKLKS